MRRREFLGALGGAAALPLAARAQQPAGMRRMGALMAAAEDDPVRRGYMVTFREGLQKLGCRGPQYAGRSRTRASNPRSSRNE
jgi:putative ABC transport system substrate-binding protein